MRKSTGIGGLLIVAFACGCPFNNVPPDNEESVLEGTWQVTFEDPGDIEGFDIEATFDSDGQLTLITAESPEGGTASLDVSGDSTTTVEGNDVTITIPTAGGTRIINGELSEDENTITASLSAELELPSGDLEITLPASDFTLERIEE